jgi:hypothetical protein
MILKKTKNLKLILSAFDQISILKIKFHKNELFCFGETQDEAAGMEVQSVSFIIMMK